MVQMFSIAETKFKRLDIRPAEVAVTMGDLQSGTDFQVLADTVLGADGGRSAVRSFITPPGASRSTGVTAFRATVANTDHVTYPLHTIREIWGNGRASLRFGYCRMTPKHVYWWANIVGTDLPQHPGGNASSSTFIIPRTDIVLRPFGRKLAERFSTFPFDAASLLSSTTEAEIERTEIRAFGLGSNPWLDPTGRVILVGDAARQSDLPYLHHGSSMAIEDGYFLANALDLSNRAGRSRRPLDAYELERREHTQALHNIWNSFDRVAASRNPASRFINSKVLSVSLTKHLMDSGSTTERREDGKALQTPTAPESVSERNGLLPFPPLPPLV
jgi:2-polyprenyl-6-methoxyphenol hydroxylase-like FAD-dependent oxidoreductase